MFQSKRVAIAAFLVLVLAFAAGGALADEHSGPGSLQDARAYWLDERTIAWDAPAGSRVTLHSSDTAGLAIGRDGVDGARELVVARMKELGLLIPHVTKNKEGEPVGIHSHIGRLDHSPDLPLSRQVRDAVDAQPGLEVPRSASFI